MSKDFPLTQLAPIRIRSIRIIRISVLKPILLKPITSPGFLIRMRGMNPDDSQGSHDHDKNTHKLENHEEAVEPSTGFGADRVCDAHDNENENREEFV